MNAEATGFLLEHCRSAKAALVMFTITTYKPHPDPWYPFHEDDPLGDAMATPSAPYSVSKIAQEAVTIVNWGRDEPASVQEWSAYFAELRSPQSAGIHRAAPVPPSRTATRATP